MDPTASLHGLRQPGHQTHHSPPSNAKAKNKWICTSTPLIYLCGSGSQIFQNLGSQLNILDARGVTRRKRFHAEYLHILGAITNNLGLGNQTPMICAHLLHGMQCNSLTWIINLQIYNHSYIHSIWTPTEAKILWTPMSNTKQTYQLALFI